MSALHKIKKHLEEAPVCSIASKRLSDPENAENWSKFKDSGASDRFKDESFPADKTSLIGPNAESSALPGNSSDVIQMYNTKVKQWLRPTEIDSLGQPSLWGSQGVKPTGVVQGQLGDCWFLAAAGALAEKEERVKAVFTNQQYPQSGIFQLKLWHKGVQKNVIIDDRLPVDGDKVPVNAKMSPLGAWWVPILEKAYAKMHVSYLNMNGGIPAEALRTFTGMPVKIIKTAGQTDEALWKEIYEANRLDYIMTAACDSSIHGLVSNHAYTLYTAVEVMDPQTN